MVSWETSRGALYKHPRKNRNIQVDIIQLELLQTGLQCGRNIGHVLVHLGGDEQLVSGQVALRNGLAELFLGSVDFGSVEVIISQVHGTLDRVDQVAIQIGVGVLEPCCAGPISDLVGWWKGNRSACSCNIGIA